MKVTEARLRELTTVADKLGSASLTADEAHALADEVRAARDLRHDLGHLLRVAAHRLGKRLEE